MGKLARAELGEVDAVAAAQAADLAFVVRTLRRVAAGLVDEAVPDVDIDDARLLGAAAIELVEIGRVLARLGTALRGETDPEHRNAGALERRDGGVDPLDVGELPLFRAEFPRPVVGLARLLRRHVRILWHRFRRLRLLLGVGRRRRTLLRRGRLRGRCRWLLRAALRRGGPARLSRRRRRSLLADRLAIVVADHHDDELGFLGGDDLARHLRPLDVAARVVADEAGIGAMLAHDRNLGFLGKCVLEPVGQPVRVAIAHHHDRGGGLRLFLRRRRRARIVDRRFAFLRAAVLTKPAALAAEPVVVVIVVLLLALRTAAPIPELGLRRQQQREARCRDRYDRKRSEFETWAHGQPPTKLPVLIIPNYIAAAAG